MPKQADEAAERRRGDRVVEVVERILRGGLVFAARHDRFSIGRLRDDE
jgi:hypothetical protein